MGSSPFRMETMFVINSRLSRLVESIERFVKSHAVFQEPQLRASWK